MLRLAFIVRAFISVHTILLCGAALTQPTSHVGQVLRETCGPAIVIAMMAAAIIGMFDVIINDVLSDKYKFRFAHRYRPLVQAALALLYLLFSAAFFRASEGVIWGSLQFATIGGFCLCIAFASMQWRAARGSNE